MGSSLGGAKISPNWKANTSLETSLWGGGAVETYLYNAEAALFSPLGLLGLGSPAMLISAMKGHAAMTRHVHGHWEPSPITEQGRHSPTICRNKLPHTSHHISSCFQHVWGPAGPPQEGKYILALGQPLHFPLQSY